MGRLKNEAVTYHGTRKSNAEASKDHTRKQTAAVQALKNHFFVINTALPTVFRDNAIEGFDQSSFAPTGKLDNSPKKLIDHADRIRDLVAKINEPLRPFFGGESPIEVHDRLRNALDAVNATQEANREALPQRTKDLNVIKGRLVELIDDMNRAGQIAFIGQAEIAACFNKDILLRARRGGGSKQAEEKPAAGEVTPVVADEILE
jgi:hypothetical protein